MPPISKLDPRSEAYAAALAECFGVPQSVAEQWRKGSTDPFAELNDDTSDGHVYLYGPLVPESSFERFFGGISPGDFIEAMDDAGDDVTIHVDSPGGSVFAGSAIANNIVSRLSDGIKIHVVIDGLAASAASWIPLAVNSCSIAEMGMMMFHRPMAVTFGNADDMRATAVSLDKVEKNATRMMDRRMTFDAIDAEDAADLVRGPSGTGSWLNAEETVAVGIAQKIEEAPELPGAGAGNGDDPPPTDKTAELTAAELTAAMKAEVEVLDAKLKVMGFDAE